MDFKTWTKPVENCRFSTVLVVVTVWKECLAELPEFRWNFTGFPPGIKLRMSVKFRGVPLNTKFRKIKIPPELFFDEIIDTM